MSKNDTHEAFLHLVEHVQACRLCPRMEGRRRVFGPANGSSQAQVFFVAEAPGRLGGDRTGIPLLQDQTGRNFTLLLQAANLRREDIFITNAVLCNPRDERGRNAAPAAQEIRNCSPHLRQTIELIAPRYVVALGQVALKALNLIAPHNIKLAREVGQPVAWHGRWLIPLYHPGPRAQLHRPFATQMEDFRCLGAFLQGYSSFRKS